MTENGDSVETVVDLRYLLRKVFHLATVDSRPSYLVTYRHIISGSVLFISY